MFPSHAFHSKAIHDKQNNPVAGHSLHVKHKEQNDMYRESLPKNVYCNCNATCLGGDYDVEYSYSAGRSAVRLR